MSLIETAALAAIFRWVWKEYGREITDKGVRGAWERLRWEDRALRYVQKVERLYGTMQVLGQPRPVSLEGIYTAVSLLDRPAALSRYTVEEMQADFTGRGGRYFHASGEEKRRDGLDMVKSGENLFILGKPGAGKTTFLKHVAISGVGGKLGERVPIFIGLKQLSDSKLSVFEYVVEQFDICDFPDAAGYLDRLLKAGKAILLFDGLDEVNAADDERKRLIADVENFTRKYDLCQRLITCRLAANDYVFQGYTIVEMADFDEAQIRQFVARWFSGDEERRNLFLSELEQPASMGLRELARVPLLLALLCLGFEDTLKLASRRVELYEEALDALLKKWDSGRNIRRDEVYRELSLKRKEGMLSQAAAETFERGEYFIPRKTLARSFEDYLARMPNVTGEIDGEVVLQAIIAQHGLFYERAHDIYSFAHLTFQEYFTARYVVENEARGALSRLIENYDDPRYREVFLLAAAQLPDATAFFDLFLDTLEDEARKYPAVMTFLRWIADKASTATNVKVRPKVRPVAMRGAYLSLARVLNRRLNRIFKINFDRTDFLVYGRYPDLDALINRFQSLFDNYQFDTKLARELNFDTTRAINRARFLGNLCQDDQVIDADIIVTNVIVNALNDHRDHILVRNSKSILTRDVVLTNGWLSLRVILSFWDHLTLSEWLTVAHELVAASADLSGHSGNSKMQRQLAALSERIIASEGSLDRHILEDLADELQMIMEEDCDLKFPSFSDEDWNALKRYMDGNRLLIECLDQAVVADRAAIEERLLLPEG